MAVFMLLVMATWSAQGEPPPDLKNLIESEQAFARFSETAGMRDAFLAYLAQDSIVLAPAPQDGRKAYAERPNVPGMLVWKPLFADISAAADLGYTTGPWIFKDPGQEDSPPIHGHYVSVWKKQPEGGWRVVIDGGVSHPRLDEKEGDVEFPPSPEHAGAAGEVFSETSLASAEEEFAEDVLKKGFWRALKQRCLPEARIYRPNHPPALGIENAGVALRDWPESLNWETGGERVASSHDLGYTYGVAHTPKELPGSRVASYSFLRIWKKNANGEWKIAVDLANPLPADSQ